MAADTQPLSPQLRAAFGRARIRYPAAIATSPAENHAVDAGETQAFAMARVARC